MTYWQLFAALKQAPPAGAYLLDGEDDWTRERAIQIIREAVLCGASAAWNDTLLPESATLAQLEQAIRTVGMLGGRRLVTLQNAGTLVRGLGKKPQPLCALMQDISPDCVLILEQPGAAKWPKALKEVATAVTFDGLSEADAVRFLAAECKKAGATLDARAAAELYQRRGDMRVALSEVRKLAALVAAPGGSGQVDVALVQRQVSADLSYSVFAMLDAFFAGHTKQGMAQLDALLGQGQSALGVLSLMGMRLRQVMRAQAMLQQKRPMGEIAQRLGVQAFVAKKAVAAAKKADMATLQAAYQKLLQADERIKSCSLPDGTILEAVVAGIFC